MTILRLLKHWSRGFKSHSRHRCLIILCLYVVLCVGRGLVKGCSAVRGVPPTLYRIKKLKTWSRHKKGCRTIIIIIIIIVIKYVCVCERERESVYICIYIYMVNNITNSVALVRERTTPTERQDNWVKAIVVTGSLCLETEQLAQHVETRTKR
jgi:hypothetical protein